MVKACCIGNSIVLPHVRFVNHGSKEGRHIMMMFHSIVLKTNGKHTTLGCDKMDDSGFCQGHQISRREFLEKYCSQAEAGNTGHKAKRE
jgi:hypothetical protein